MKLSTLCAACALALAAHTALADDNSMSRYGGESYRAFEAARIAAPSAVIHRDRAPLAVYDDNSMSRWNGDSYQAFAESAKDSGRATLASLRRPPMRSVEPAHMTRLPRGPLPTNPFSDATG